MSLQVMNDLLQGSEEWHSARRGIVTASVVGQFITPKTIKVAGNTESRSLTRLLVSERITGWTEDTFQSFDMMRGHDIEPIARDLYSEKFAPVTQAGFMVRVIEGLRIGYSPDGLVGDDGLIEIKSRKPKEHLSTILSGEVPVENMAQIQCGLLVSGRQWCDYISFCGGMPMWVLRVIVNPIWSAAIIEAATSFEKDAEQMIKAYHEAVAGLPLTERTFFDQEMVI